MAKSRPVFIAAAVLLVFCRSDIASAQIAPPPNIWTHGTTLNLFVGAASDRSETGPIAGGSVGWEVTPWVALEGSGSWLGRNNGAGAFAADLKALVNLSATRPVVPFLEGGIGLYRAWFDLSRSTIPDFYQERVTAGAGTLNTFTDPSFVAGGGVNLFVARHVAIRPDVEATFVRRNSQTYVVTAVSVHMAYHFEDHPITPSRSR